jgi:hypothetical protein
MDTTQKKREKKDRFWEKIKFNQNKDPKKKAPSKKNKKQKPKVKMVIPSRKKAEKK